MIKVQIINNTRVPIIRETLTRMGIYTKTETNNKTVKTLKQICYIVSEGEDYYIVHHKEIQKKKLTDIDYARRNTAATMLEKWGEINILNPEELLEYGTILSLFILPHKDKFKPDWQFESPITKDELINWKK